MDHDPVEVRPPLAVETAGALDRTCRVVSYVLHPVLMMLATSLLLSVQAHGNALRALGEASLLLLGLLPGLLYLGVGVARGKFGHLHLLDKEERHVVLPLVVLGLLAVFLAYELADAPAPLVRGVALGTLGGLGVVVITRFWKISLHASVGAGCAALFAATSPITLGVMGALALLSGLARLPIRHHTPAQVVVGWAYGLAVPLLLRPVLPPL